MENKDNSNKLLNLWASLKKLEANNKAKKEEKKSMIVENNLKLREIYRLKYAPSLKAKN